MKSLFAAAAIGLASMTGLATSAAAAETCGGTYKVRPGDSLSLIADTQYKDVGKWTLIHSNNIAKIGPKPNAIQVGMKLQLTCIDGLPTGLPGGTEIGAVRKTAAQPIKIQPGTAEVRKKINLLTGDDYAPFTAKNLHNGGLLTDVVNAAMKQAAPPQGYAIHWVDNWDAHFDPLLSNALLDLGFPWYSPDCDAEPDSYRCQNFLFSDPMFEMLMLLFTSKTNPMQFARDEDIYGKTICRPLGYATFYFEENGRRWMSDKKIKAVTPATPADCYEMVLEGKADAVLMNEFTGRTQLKNLGLADKFNVVPQPMSIGTLHVIVHKTHPQAQELLAMINTGLRGIRDNGTYQKIIEDHMARIWAEF